MKEKLYRYGKKMSFIERVKGTLRDPEKTMVSIADQPMIEEAVMIVGIYAILSSVVAYIQSNKISYVMEGFENMQSSMQSLMTISMIVGVLIMTFFIWFIISGVVHLLSLAAGGEGKFYPQVMTITGFSMLPVLFSVIISIGLFSTIEPQVINISPGNPADLKELYGSPSYIISGILGILLQIWASIILYFGIKSAHKISSSASVIIVGIPLVLSALSLIWTYIGTGIL